MQWPPGAVDSRQSRCPGTHRNACVLVQDDLQQVWRQDGWGLEALLRLGDIGLLMVGSWWGAGQLCGQMGDRTSVENAESWGHGSLV